MKTVVVTGATRGIGLSIARQLVEQDYRVIALARSVSDALSEIMSTHPDQVFFYESDLADIDKIPALVRRVTDAHGTLYGLVNNAGIGPDGVLATQHATAISQVLCVNLEAPITLTKYACRAMLKERQGRIINISSIIAQTGFSGLSVYGASKAGLEGFTRSLSRELGRANITVNCVAPGYVETDMSAGLDPRKMQSIRRRAPLGLPVEDDIAGAVSYLLSPAAEKVTGTVLTVDGGSTA